MDWLVISNIALWIGFIVMTLICLALARQVGVLYERVAPAGALMINQTLKAGARAPELAIATIQGGIVTVGKPRADRSQLLYFISPDCPVCKSLLPIVQSLARSERSWLDVVLASDGDEQDHSGYVAANKLQAFPYVVSELLGKSYGVAKLPYAVLIDEKGSLVSMGIVNSREHLESLFEAKEQKVASIQEYLRKAHPETAKAGLEPIPVESINGVKSEEHKP